MSEVNKNTDKSFLAKFQGKANKVNKTGMQSVLTPVRDPQANDKGKEDEYMRKVDLDDLIPSNPEKKSIEKNSKRTQSFSKPPLKSPKQQYVPTSITPMHHSKDQSVTSHPPSRSSNSTVNSRGKYVFGKYLKLDKQALGHIDFLHDIEQKSFFKRSIRGSAQLH